MSDQMEATVTLTNAKVQFIGKTRSNPAVVMDYFPPIGDGQGYTGLELLLVSLAGCVGTSVVGILRKMKKTITGFKVNAQGIRRQQHPTSFQKIFLEFVVDSPDAQEADVQKAIRLSEESICPVWAMLKNNVEVVSKIKITAS
jgi:putative redox protein